MLEDSPAPLLLVVDPKEEFGHEGILTTHPDLAVDLERFGRPRKDPRAFELNHDHETGEFEPGALTFERVLTVKLTFSIPPRGDIMTLHLNMIGLDWMHFLDEWSMPPTSVELRRHSMYATLKYPHMKANGNFFFLWKKIDGQLQSSSSYPLVGRTRTVTMTTRVRR